MAPFVKLNACCETEHTLVLPSNSNNGPAPAMKLIIRSYCEGVDTKNASDFSNVRDDLGYGLDRSPTEDEDVAFTENPSHEHTVNLEDRRKVSLMFSAATGNSSRINHPQPSATRTMHPTITESEETVEAEKRAHKSAAVAHESAATAELDELEREAQAQHAATLLMSMTDTGFLNNTVDDDVFGDTNNRDRLVSMQYGGKPWSNDDLDGF